jgi:hypothetical protein
MNKTLTIETGVEVYAQSGVGGNLERGKNILVLRYRKLL